MDQPGASRTFDSLPVRSNNKWNNPNETKDRLLDAYPRTSRAPAPDHLGDPFGDLLSISLAGGGFGGYEPIYIRLHRHDRSAPPR